MALKLMRNIDHTPTPAYKVLGPEADHIFPYFLKGGFPVVCEEVNPPSTQHYEWVDPTPGMVVVSVRTLQLFHVDCDGDLVPIGLRLPRDYNDGRRLGVELEAVSET